MITIEITNLDELVKEHRGPVTALLGKIVADVEGEVEKIIIEEIRNEFERRGVRANFCSIEGIRLKDRQAFSVQYHPEATPGPHDSRYLFDDFVALMRN